MTWSQLDALRWVLDHPLNRGRRGRALLRWTAAQVRARLAGRYRSVPFIDDTRLYVGTALTVPNMQHYAGIGEMDVMGFLMHYLSPDDLFVDVGANVGVITVLGAGVSGSRTIAFEPDPVACDWLHRNVALNNIEERVTVHRVALGESGGTLSMTTQRGAANRAITANDGPNREVPCSTLDAMLAGAVPTVIKIDVEGYELPVLRGAQHCLKAPQLRAVILELRGHGAHYGHDENELRNMMSAAGFTGFSYDPLTRHLPAVADCPWRVRDTIFLRDPVSAAERLRTAPRHRVIWNQTV